MLAFIFGVICGLILAVILLMLAFRAAWDRP